MARASLIFREKVIDEAGNIVELVLWKVPATSQNTSGVRYRLAFIRRGETVPAVLYDNHRPKGHHRHIEGIEEPYVFVDVDRLLADRASDVRWIIGERKWPRP
jgi:Family of unknown function (DUF6516)